MKYKTKEPADLIRGLFFFSPLNPPKGEESPLNPPTGDVVISGIKKTSWFLVS